MSSGISAQKSGSVIECANEQSRLLVELNAWPSQHLAIDTAMKVKLQAFLFQSLCNFR
eukprot:m.431274 g.431274  ORF g.431274 m.431274 type:complete len:58 (-) comp17276_c0_seq1:334-507(-)